MSAVAAGHDNRLVVEDLPSKEPAAEDDSHWSSQEPASDWLSTTQEPAPDWLSATQEPAPDWLLLELTGNASMAATHQEWTWIGDNDQFQSYTNFNSRYNQKFICVS